MLNDNIKEPTLPVPFLTVSLEQFIIYILPKLSEFSFLIVEDHNVDLSNPKGENDQLYKGLINQAPTMKFENKSLNLVIIKGSTGDDIH
jgi:hypothetical protein